MNTKQSNILKTVFCIMLGLTLGIWCATVYAFIEPVPPTPQPAPTLQILHHDVARHEERIQDIENYLLTRKASDPNEGFWEFKNEFGITNNKNKPK